MERALVQNAQLRLCFHACGVATSGLVAVGVDERLNSSTGSGRTRCKGQTYARSDLCAVRPPCGIHRPAKEAAQRPRVSYPSQDCPAKDEQERWILEDV